jgi:hypothetical protein
MLDNNEEQIENAPTEKKTWETPEISDYDPAKVIQGNNSPFIGDDGSGYS